MGSAFCRGVKIKKQALIFQEKMAGALQFSFGHKCCSPCAIRLCRVFLFCTLNCSAKHGW